MILSEYEVPYSQPKGYLLHLLFWTPYLGWIVPRTINFFLIAYFYLYWKFSEVYSVTNEFVGLY